LRSSEDVAGVAHGTKVGLEAVAVDGVLQRRSPRRIAATMFIRSGSMIVPEADVVHDRDDDATATILRPW
jgi:hypothetical protein